MKKIFLAMAILGLTLTATSCHEHYKPDQTLVPPTLAVAPSTVSGVVTDMAGMPVAGATVKYDSSKEVTTDSKGAYIISGIEQGAHTLTVLKEGFVQAKHEFNVPDVSATTVSILWSTMLEKHIAQVIPVHVVDGAVGEVTTEAVKDNAPGEIEIAVAVPADAVKSNTSVKPEDIKITIEPIYNYTSITRAASEDMILGSALSCNADVTLTKPVSITFKVDDSVKGVAEVMQLRDGNWVKADFNTTSEGVEVLAKEFTQYGIFVPMTVTTTQNGTIPVQFARESSWDNIYGEREIFISSVPYSFEAGNVLKTSAKNNLEGLLVERIARQFGLMLTPMTGSYEVNAKFPVGTGFDLDITQQVGTITIEAGATRAGVRVSASTFGNLNFTPRTYSRDHNGGGSGR